MPIMHELDAPIFKHISELDSSQTPGMTSHGDLSARFVKSWLKENKTQLSPDALYLALGAGQAYPEEAFARHLGISPDRVTMVDREFRDYTKRRLKEKFSGAEMVETGIFSYLTNPPKTGFSLVSAFGIEYVFKRETAPEIFVQSMPKLVCRNGIVCIGMYNGDDVDKLWEEKGFEVVMGYTGFLDYQMYVYKG